MIAMNVPKHETSMSHSEVITMNVTSIALTVDLALDFEERYCEVIVIC
jgi:hypothetical protein